MVRKVAEYLGWRYVSSLDSNNAGWYEPCTSYTKNFIYIDGEPFEFVCRNHYQLESSLSFESLFGAIKKIENEDVKFGYSWEDGDGLHWNNERIVFNAFKGVMEFEMERQLDPAKTISERKVNYDNIKKDLIEMICETLDYLEKCRS